MTSFSRILLSTVVAFSLCTSNALADESAPQKEEASLKSILARLGSDLYAYAYTHERSVVAAVATAIVIGGGLLIFAGPSSSYKENLDKLRTLIDKELGYKEGYAKHQSELDAIDTGIKHGGVTVRFKDLAGNTNVEKISTLRRTAFECGMQALREMADLS